MLNSRTAWHRQALKRLQCRTRKGYSMNVQRKKEKLTVMKMMNTHTQALTLTGRQRASGQDRAEGLLTAKMS